MMEISRGNCHCGAGFCPPNDRPGVIERAFQVAKSGKVSNIKDLRMQLAEEGYSNATVVLTGRSLRQQISRMIVEAKAAPD